MCVRLCAALAGCLASFAAIGFDYFEHRYLGNRAFESARSYVAEEEKPVDPAKKFVAILDAVSVTRLRFNVRPQADQIAGRLLHDLPFQFGDLAALAGDFAGDPKQLAELIHGLAGIEKDERHVRFGVSKMQALIIDSRRQWLSACKWIHRTRLSPHGARGPFDPPSKAAPLDECFARLDLPITQRYQRHAFGAEGYKASREEKAEHERIPDYVSLAAQNASHFPRYSWKAYSDHHQRALQFARCFRDGKEECTDPEGTLEHLQWVRCQDDQKCRDAGKRDDVLVAALLEEAFAQHYLQDSFASGHIGSKYSRCLWRFIYCRPTKTRLQQTHDSLNELGLEVRLVVPADYLTRNGDSVPFDDIAWSGWTSFGDHHLFIAEADFHRALLLRVVTESLKEVLANAAKGVAASDACRMCTTLTFPVPKEDRFLSDDPNQANPPDLTGHYKTGELVKFETSPSLLWDERSTDQRVSGIPHEGWKVGVGLARQWYHYNEGDARLADNGVLLLMEHVRSIGAYLPNSYGFEYAHVPDRGSAYLGTAAWLFPGEVTRFQFGLKAKFGWRTEENFTKINPGEQRGGGFQVSFPVLEFNAEIYRPVAFFVQWSLHTHVFRKRFFEGSHDYSESYKNGEYSLLMGLRLDLAGI
jgi:hypothetical protein